jgi:hypothetical protein
MTLTMTRILPLGVLYEAWAATAIRTRTPRRTPNW